MKRLLAVLVVAVGLFALPAVDAQTTTNCYLTAGNTMSCISSGSNTPPPVVVTPTPAPDPEAWRQAGEGIGIAIGAGIVAVRQHQIASFCKKNPGQNYRGTQCLSYDDQATKAEALFIIHTPKFHQSDENFDVLEHWVRDRCVVSRRDACNKLDPTKEDSYQQAWKALRKTGTVQINK